MLNRTQRKESQNEGGFTLVELLVGIVVGLIVVSGLTVAWGFFARQSDYILKAAQFNQDTRSVLQVISQEIRRAVDPADITVGRVLELQNVSDCVETNAGITCNNETDAPIEDPVTGVDTWNCILFDANIVSRFALEGPTGAGLVAIVGSSADLTRTTARPTGFRLAKEPDKETGKLQVWFDPGALPGDSRGTCSDSANWVTLLQPLESGVETIEFWVTTEGSECLNTEILVDLTPAQAAALDTKIDGRCPATNDPDGGAWVESLLIGLNLSGTSRIGNGPLRPFSYADTIKIRNLGFVDYDAAP
jgi:type II secretory pathway pseudopilin PulG